jgi:hypothetical protein
MCLFAAILPMMILVVGATYIMHRIDRIDLRVELLVQEMKERS